MFLGHEHSVPWKGNLGMAIWLGSEETLFLVLLFPELLSPSLDSETKLVSRGQNVSLICSNQNKSLRITYVLFRREKHLRTHDGKGEPMIFNLSISEAHELGPYKCKAQVPNCSVIKYSREFNFTFVDPVITPVLNIHVINIKTDRHIILRCISFNGSLPITYTFFEKDIAISQPISKHVREPAELNITKNNAREGEEYRCKAKNKLPDHERYSQPVFINPPPGGDSCPFCLQLLLPGLLLVLIVIIPILAFWILPKYKASKFFSGFCMVCHWSWVLKIRIIGPITLFLVFCPGTGHSQEIHYATPVFQEVAPGVHGEPQFGIRHPIKMRPWSL
uniref:Mast cell immunoglobulin like receptor 1 n=1 Tax=Ursus americanus TaxID=9643 RepID=A0A452SR72_URSAM